MKNLAGDKNADRYVSLELTRCGIPIVDLGGVQKGEAPTKLQGKLGPFTFERYWYYWVALGPMPLTIAEKLYEVAVGKTDIRAGGHCGCPPPEEQAVRRTLGGKVIELDPDGRREAQWDAMAADLGVGFLPPEKKPMYVPSLAHVANYVTIVDCYHIDSELGLYIFAQAIKEHGLS